MPRSRAWHVPPISPPPPQENPDPPEILTEDEAHSEYRKILQRLKEELIEKQEHVRSFEEWSRLTPPITQEKAESEHEEETKRSVIYERESLQEGESSEGIRLPNGKERVAPILSRQQRSRSRARARIIREREDSRWEDSNAFEGIRRQMKILTRADEELCSQVRVLQSEMRQMSEEKQEDHKPHQSELSNPTDDSTSSVVSAAFEPSQMIDAACVRSGLGYMRWLGEYVNGTVLVLGAYSLRELKSEPCESCHMRGLACVELTERDLLHGELPKDSCCGWCISEGGAEVSEYQRRQRSQATFRQIRYESAKAADLATMNGERKSSLPEPDGYRRLYRFFLPEGGSISRSTIHNFLCERFSDQITVDLALDGNGYVITTGRPVPDALIRDIRLQCRIISGDSARYHPQRPSTPMASRGPRSPSGQGTHYADDVVEVTEEARLPPEPQYHRAIRTSSPKMRARQRKESPKNEVHITRERGVIPGAPPPRPALVRRTS